MADDGSGSNRRRHLRVPLNLLVQYRFDTFDEFMAEYAADMSEGGLFIETDEPRTIGDMIYVQFAMRDGSRLIEVLGRVAHVVPPGGSEPHGMGIEFMNMDSDSQDLVLKAMKELTEDLE